MKKNKLLILLLSSVIAFSSMFGCSGGGNLPPPDPDIGGTDSETVTGDRDIKIKEIGKELDYVIVMPTIATEVEKNACNEFKKYFDIALSTDIKIVLDNVVLTSNYFSFGKTKQLASSGIVVDYDKLAKDGFVIQTVNDNVFLEGGQRGVLYSAYDYLEKYLGVRFFAKNETKIPKLESFTMKEVKILEIPAFEGRDSHMYEMRQNADFSVKLRYNGVVTPLEEKHGYGQREDWSELWAHTVLDLLPYSIYGGEHKDWYREDTRYSTPQIFRGQICLTKEAVRLELTKNLKKWIVDRPNATYFMIGQDDICPLCDCETCKPSHALYAESGTLIRFVNAVAEDIEKWCNTELGGRKVKIVTFAYQGTEMPPTKLDDNGKIVPRDPSVVPRANVAIRMTTIGCCFYHSLFDTKCSENNAFQANYKGWKAICDDFLLWTYCTNFKNYLLPFGNWGAIKENYINFYETKVFNIFDQGTYDTPKGEFQELREYLQAKLMWNPYLDIEPIIEEFIDGYYHEGAQYIKEYFKLINLHYASLNQAKGGNWHMKLYDSPTLTDAEYFPRRLLEQMLDLTMNAYKSYSHYSNANEKEEMENRALALSLSPRYLMALNYTIYYPNGDRVGFGNSLIDDCNRVGLVRYAEAETIDALKVRLGI